MDTAFTNRYAKKNDIQCRGELDKFQKTAQFLTMAEIVCNYKITNEARLECLFNRTSDLQTVWEYIWLSYKAREAITDTEIDIFATEQVLANFKLLCLQHSLSSKCNAEHREMLYD